MVEYRRKIMFIFPQFQLTFALWRMYLSKIDFLNGSPLTKSNGHQRATIVKTRTKL